MSGIRSGHRQCMANKNVFESMNMLNTSSIKKALIPKDESLCLRVTTLLRKYVLYLPHQVRLLYKDTLSL